MSDIFEEVQEEVRKERWEQLWKKYGNFAIAGAVAVVLGVGGYRAWQAYQHRQSEQASDTFLAAQDLAQNGNLVGAESAFTKLAAEAPSGYSTAAKFAQAAVLLSESKREAALTVLRELTSVNDVVLANTARLQIGWVEADYAPKERIESTLAPLMGPTNPFRFAASEVKAYAALRLGNRAEALATYDKLGKDAAAPGGLRQRAAALAEYLRANPDISSLPTAVAPPMLAPRRPPTATPATPAPAPAQASPAAPAATPAPVPASEASPQ